MNDTKPRKTNPRWIAACIFFAALAIRLVYLVESSKNPTFLVPIVDAENYDSIARMLAFSGTMNHAFFWQGFFYPLFLAGVYSLSGGSIIAAKLIQLALGSVTAVLAYLIGSRAVDRNTGVIAGAVTALCGPLVFFEGELLATGWAAFWAAASILLVMKADRDRSVGSWLAVGIVAALATITRGTFLPFVAASAVWLLARSRRAERTRPRAAAGRRAHRAGKRGTAALGGALLLGFLLVALPVSILSSRSAGQFGFLPGSGPINLYIGNNADTDSTLMIRPGAEWRDLTRLPTVHGSTGPVEDQRFFMNRFRAYLREQPWGYAAGLLRKAIQFASSRELPRNVDVYIYRNYSKILSVLVWKAGRFGFPFGVLLPLAIVGMAAYRRRLPTPVYLFLLLYPLSIILVFVTSRYRTPIIPVLAVPAAAGLVFIANAVRRGKRRGALMLAAAVAAIAVLASVSGPFATERYDYEAEMHCCVGFELSKRNRLDEAVSQLETALLLKPGYGDAHKFLGLIRNRQRRPAEARQHLERALESDPDSYLLRYYLGVSLVNLGMRNEAAEQFERALAGAEAAREDVLVERIRAALRGTVHPAERPPSDQ